MVEMELYEIRIDETNQEQVIVLKERYGERTLPILIGIFEAQAIQIKVSNITLPRPLTHDLLVSVIGALGGVVDRIVINSLKENTFYARLIFKSADGMLDVDARPSDAIALALRLEVPIFVEEEVLTQVA